MNDSTCRWPDCEREIYGRGFCKPHHHKSWRAGHVDEPWLVYEARAADRSAAQAAKHCKWPGCSVAKVKGHGLCLSHYRRAEVLGDMSEPWTLWRPAITCATCGSVIHEPIHNKRFCSPSCLHKDYQKRNYDRILVRQREHSRRRHARKKSTQVEKFTDKDIRMAHGDVCYLCGEKINFKLKFPHPKSRSVDHVIPLARGGSHTLENVAMTHYQCNLRKNVKEATCAPQPTIFAL